MDVPAHPRTAGPAELVARAAHRLPVPARDRPVPALREAVPGAVQAVAGPAGRPGYVRGRSRHRDEAATRHLASARLVYRTQVDKARLRGKFWAALDMVPNAVIGLLLLLGALAVSRHELTLGGLVAFVTLTLLLIWPIEAMGFIIASGQEAATAAQRVYEIFDTRPAITDPAQPSTDARLDRPGLASGRWQSGRKAARTAARAEAAPAAAARAEAARAESRPSAARPARPAAGSRPRGAGQLSFDRVAFSYPEARRPVLRSITLELTPGETVALVGATGSGKTTLLHLVPRLADVTGGRI